jgi:trehalose 6-phosphate phosphatase
MTYLFSDSGRAALHGFVDRATLFAFDLDGTLAPIVADPARIKISQEVRTCLIRLGKLAPVAIVTGRARANALAHLGFHPHFLVGNHGAEGFPGGAELESGFVSLCKEWEKQLRGFLPFERNIGIEFENKGTTLSLHYRSASDRVVAQLLILDAIQRLTPLPRRVSGKFVENLVPQDAPHKGEALLLIMQQLGCRRALFVGDDETDEDVFRLGDDSIFGIRVGMSSKSAAGTFIREQNEIGPLVEVVITVLEHTLAKDEP